MKGKLIVFEGIDGCGKTTQLLKLIEWLSEEHKYKKYQIVYAKEPTFFTKAGLILRKKLASSSEPEKDGYLFCELMIKDRAEHCTKLIKPALDFGCIVLCDRYSHSTFAYQQAQGISFDKILEEHKKYKILKPNLTLIFDVPAKKAIKRIEKAREKKYLFEKINFLEKVRKNYLKLGSLLQEKIVVIDGTRKIEEIFENVKIAVEKILE